jgi:hypothetical protein
LDIPGRKARVRFDDLGITSDWLIVLQHFKCGIHVEPDNRHAHSSACGGTSSIPDHDHPETHLTYWMPEVGDAVLALYIPVEDGDGFILGGI